jgi:hypothetical protein
MHDITENVLSIISGEIEKLLLEEREGIAFAYKKIPDGIKVSIGVTLDPSSQGVVVNYQLSYPLEPAPAPATKQTIKKKQTINKEQANLFDRLIPDGSGIDSVTLTGGSKSVTLNRGTT